MSSSLKMAMSVSMVEDYNENDVIYGLLNPEGSTSQPTTAARMKADQVTGFFPSSSFAYSSSTSSSSPRPGHHQHPLPITHVHIPRAPSTSTSASFADNLMHIVQRDNQARTMRAIAKNNASSRIQAVLVLHFHQDQDESSGK